MALVKLHQFVFDKLLNAICDFPLGWCLEQTHNRKMIVLIMESLHSSWNYNFIQYKLMINQYQQI